MAVASGGMRRLEQSGVVGRPDFVAEGALASADTCQTNAVCYKVDIVWR